MDKIFIAKKCLTATFFPTGFLTDAFLCLANHLTFPDMISIFMGQLQPLSRLRRPLRQFVSERVLNGSGITDDNLQRATEGIVAEILPDVVTLVVSGGRGREMKGGVGASQTTCREPLRALWERFCLTLLR
jgi:hypothetical protein